MSRHAPRLLGRATSPGLSHGDSAPGSPQSPTPPAVGTRREASEFCLPLPPTPGQGPYLLPGLCGMRASTKGTEPRSVHRARGRTRREQPRQGSGGGEGKAPGRRVIDGASLATVSPIGGSIRLRTAWPQTSCSLFKLRPLLRAKAGTPRRAAPSAASCRPTPPPRRVWWLRLPLRAVLDPLGCPWRLGVPSAKRSGTFSVCTSSRALCPPGLGDPKASANSELAELKVTTPICLAWPNLPHWGLSPCLHPLQAQLPPRMFPLLGEADQSPWGIASSPVV